MDITTPAGATAGTVDLPGERVRIANRHPDGWVEFLTGAGPEQEWVPASPEVAATFRPDGTLEPEPEPVTASGTFTARRQHSSAGGHWGVLYWTNDDPADTSHRQPSPEALLDGLGQHLMPGARVRVTVEVIDPGPEPSEADHGSPWHRDHPSGLCAGCLEHHRDRFVILDCGHGRPARVWEAEGRPAVMACWDGWCPSPCGEGRVVLEVPGLGLRPCLSCAGSGRVTFSGVEGECPTCDGTRWEAWAPTAAAPSPEVPA